MICPICEDIMRYNKSTVNFTLKYEYECPSCESLYDIHDNVFLQFIGSRNGLITTHEYKKVDNELTMRMSKIKAFL